ncbi:CatB-related O-acetyltransferase [Lysobacter korlensis]|uniref:CatB-related O-acetyltransferase n=1 Tax=Lysobacter korlensis TaxID=553636 RepID=A0ABV6S2P6_9GAMM
METRPERSGAPPSAAPQPAPPAWSQLKRSGLRIESGIRFFVKKAVLEFEPPAQLSNADLHLYRGFQLGRYSFIRSGTIRHLARIGRYTSVGPRVMIGEGEHPIHWLSTSPAQYLAKQFEFYPPEAADAAQRVIPRDETNTDDSSRGLVEIGNDVWIGANVMIRRGIRIGDGAVVASGAFVNRDVAPYSIVGGLPARPIKNRFDDATIERLLRVRWWEFDIADLAGVDFPNIGAALDEIERREAAGEAVRVPIAFSQVTLSKSGFTNLRVHQAHRDAAERRLAKSTSPKNTKQSGTTTG